MLTAASNGAHAAQPQARRPCSKAARQLQGRPGEKNGARAANKRHVVPRAMCSAAASRGEWEPDVAAAGSR